MTASTLGLIGPNAEGAVRALTEAAKADDLVLRDRAVCTLGDVGSATDAEVLSALLAALKDQSASVRSNATVALRKLGRANEELAPTIITVLKHDVDEFVRSTAVYALAGIDSGTEDIVLAWSEALRDENWLVRLAAAETLRDTDLNTESAIPSLIQVLDDDDPAVQWNAFLALTNIGKPAIPALIRVLKCDDSRDSGPVIETLDTFDTQSEESIHLIMQAIMNKFAIEKPRKSLPDNALEQD